MSQPKRLATIQMAADHIAVSPKTLRRRIAAGELTAYRCGPRILRVDLTEVEQLLRPIPTVRGGAA